MKLPTDATTPFIKQQVCRDAVQAALGVELTNSRYSCQHIGWLCKEAAMFT